MSIKFTKQEASKSNGDTPRITENRELVAEVVKVEEFKNKEHPDWQTSIKFIFRVLEEPFVGAFASGLVPFMWAEKTKLDRWLLALGVQGANGDSFSSDELKGQRGRIIVKIKNGFPNVVEVEPMTERDEKRISPDAFKRSFRKPNTTQQSAQQTAQPAVEVKSDMPTSTATSAVVPASTPVVNNPGNTTVEITKDESIPF